MGEIAMNFIRPNSVFLTFVMTGFVMLFGVQGALADGILFYMQQGGHTYLLFGVNKKGQLDVPGGRPDKGESFAQAAAREAAEELCLPLDSSIRKPFNVRDTRSYITFLAAAQSWQKVGRYAITPYPEGASNPAANFTRQKEMCRKLGYQYREMSNVIWVPCDHFLSDGVIDREVRRCARGVVKAAVRQFALQVDH